MADTKFDGQKLEELKRQAEALKEEADSELKAIQACIEGMNEADDDITRAIYAIGAKYGEKFESLVASVAKLIEALAEIGKKLLEFAKDAVEGLKNTASKFVGDVSVAVVE